MIGLVVGVLIGWLSPQVGVSLQPMADIFIRLIKTIIAPLVFATLVVGIAGGGHASHVGRLGLKCLIYFEVVTTFALLVGLFCVNVFKPGAGIHLTDTATTAAEKLLSHKLTGGELITHAFPTSIIDSMARGDVLQIVVFSVIFALAVSVTKSQLILNVCHELSEVMFKYTNYVMKLAPFGVAAAIASTVGEHGLAVLSTLGKLVGTLYLSLIIFVLGVLLPIAWFAKIPMKKFLLAVKEPFIIAFSTTSSEAALPKALLMMESIGVPRRIVGFVLPLGYTFNLDGTTLYLSLASVFVAQAAGVNLTIEQQVMMMLTLMLTSKGVAAVPRASLVILAGTLATFNLPLSGVALILGVDTLMDMARTSVNVLGNCLASCVLAKWEGAFGEPDEVAEVEKIAAMPEIGEESETPTKTPETGNADAKPEPESSQVSSNV